MSVQVETSVITWGIGALVAGGISFGIVKGKLSEFMTFKDHQSICHNAIESVYKTIGELRSENREMYGMIKEIHGMIKVKKNLDDTNH